jgi:hypothetical protein
MWSATGGSPRNTFAQVSLQWFSSLRSMRQFTLRLAVRPDWPGVQDGGSQPVDRRTRQRSSRGMVGWICASVRT